MTGFNQFNASRDADMIQGEKIYEMDFAINQGDNSTNNWIEIEIRTNPALPYRRLYINLYNSTNQQADVTGILRCFYNGKQVYQQPMRFFTNGGPSTLTGGAGGVLMPARTAASGIVYDGILMTSRGAANVFTLAPWSLFVTCDRILFSPTEQSKGATGNQAWLLACKSSSGPM